MNLFVACVAILAGYLVILGLVLNFAPQFFDFDPGDDMHIAVAVGWPLVPPVALAVGIGFVLIHGPAWLICAGLDAFKRRRAARKVPVAKVVER